MTLRVQASTLDGYAGQVGRAAEDAHATRRYLEQYVIEQQFYLELDDICLVAAQLRPKLAQLGDRAPDRFVQGLRVRAFAARLAGAEYPASGTTLRGDTSREASLSHPCRRRRNRGGRAP